MEIIVNLFILTLLEIILGIDNLVFIVVLSQRLPKQQQRLGRVLGLFAAMVMRIVLLAVILELTSINRTLFTISHHAFSLRDIVLIFGGLFLLYKGTTEVHANIELVEQKHGWLQRGKQHLWVCIMQIMLLDIVFSFDSVMTAVGISHHFTVMVLAIVLAILVMILANNTVARWIERYPTIKMLAFSYLLLIGLVLLADGLGTHIARSYIYFAVGFSLMVEVFNQLALRSRHKGRKRK